MAYVYQHKRLDNDKVFYVGIGEGIDYKRAYSKNGRTKWWKNITSKYDYKIEILEDNLTWEEACNIEKSYIKKYGRIIDGGDLVNFTEGGEGFRANHTKETISKISNTLSNKTYEEIHGLHKAELEREKRRIAALKQWKNTDENSKKETRNKIAETLKNYYKNNPKAKIQKEHVCPHCGNIGKGGSMMRWHFDNCRKNTI